MKLTAYIYKAYDSLTYFVKLHITNLDTKNNLLFTTFIDAILAKYLIKTTLVVWKDIS